MKFQLAINMERMDASLDMRDVARHMPEPTAQPRITRMSTDTSIHCKYPKSKFRAVEGPALSGPRRLSAIRVHP